MTHATQLDQHSGSVAVIHARPDRWRVVVARPAGERAEIIEAKALTAGDVDGVRQLISKHDAQSILRVLPASEVITKLVEIPDGPDDDLVDAASLLAEVHLPESIPSYRRSWGVIGGGADAGMRPAVLSGWLGRDEQDHPAILGNGSEHLTSETNALAALTRHAGGVGITVGYVDLESGSAAVIATGADMTMARSTRFPGEIPDKIGALDTALLNASKRSGSPNSSLEVLESDSARWMFSGDLLGAMSSMFSAPRNDVAWAAEFGVAASAAAGFLTAPLTERSLHRLRFEPIKKQRSRLESIVRFFESPKNAAGVIAAAAALLVGLPYVGAMLEVQAQQARADRYEAALGLDAPEALSLEDQAVLYSALDRHRWPMTKLIADIAACLPAVSSTDYATIESVYMEAGAGVSVSGIATSLEMVTAFREALAQSEVFGSIEIEQTRSIPEQAGSVEFDITGSVSRPFVTAKNLPDYASYTATDVAYGLIPEEPEPVVEADVSDEPVLSTTSEEEESVAVADASDNASGVRSARRQTGDSELSEEAQRAGEEVTRNRRNRFEGGDRTEDQTEPIPDPISDEQIAAMSNIEAMKARSQRIKAIRERPDIEQDVKDRLQTEADKLIEHARENRNRGGV